MKLVEKGRGSTVVLVHGQLCDHRFWFAQLDALARAHHVIAVSLRHCWPDEANESSRGYTTDQHARDLGELILSLGVGPVHLCGH